VAGHPIERYGELSGAIATMKPGQEAALQVWRNGKQQTMSVKIEELKEKQTQVAQRDTPQERNPTEQASALGLTVRPLEPKEKARVDTQGSLLVEEVTGPAQDAQVEPGDIILGVNGKRVSTVKELQDAAKSSGKNVALLIQRQDAQIFFPLRLP
jgi:serine protease Do